MKYLFNKLLLRNIHEITPAIWASVTGVILRTFLPLSMTLFFSSALHSEPPNLTLVKNELKIYHDSGLYQKELTKTIEKARHYIVNQAEINQKEKLHQKQALVLDIDETSLSNYSSMIKYDFCGTRTQIHQSIMAGNAPAIQPMLALYKDALNHGVKVFFVTGRSESDRDTTKKNLISAGYSQWSGLYLRPNNYAQQSIIPFKSHARKMITDKGYIILASIGDQYSDLRGGYAKKVFKLPNPFYYLP